MRKVIKFSNKFLGICINFIHSNSTSHYITFTRFSFVILIFFKDQSLSLSLSILTIIPNRCLVVKFQNILHVLLLPSVNQPIIILQKNKTVHRSIKAVLSLSCTAAIDTSGVMVHEIFTEIQYIKSTEKNTFSFT